MISIVRFSFSVATTDLQKLQVLIGLELERPRRLHYKNPGAFRGAREASRRREQREGQRQLANAQLRVLEEQRFHAVGSNKILEVDVRVIAATNKNLERRIEAAARSVFADDEAEEPETEEAAAEEPPAEAGGPTVSGQEPSPIRRQMYRRDI